MSELKPIPCEKPTGLAYDAAYAVIHQLQPNLSGIEAHALALGVAGAIQATDTELTRLQRQVVELAGTMVVQSVSHGLTCECWICKALAAADRIAKGEV